MVVTNDFRVRERLKPGALCEVRDTDGKWKAAIVDRDTIDSQVMDDTASPGVGAYLITFLEEATELAPKAKKSKRRAKGGGRA